MSIKLPSSLLKYETINDVSILDDEGIPLNREPLIKAITEIQNIKPILIGVMGSWSLGKTTTLANKYGNCSVFISPFQGLKESNAERFFRSFTSYGFSKNYRSFNCKTEAKYIIIDESKTILHQVFSWNAIKEDFFFDQLKNCLEGGIRIILLDANMDQEHLNHWANILGVSDCRLVNENPEIPKRGKHVGITTNETIFNSILTVRSFFLKLEKLELFRTVRD